MGILYTPCGPFRARPGLPSSCTPVGLGFEGLDTGCGVVSPMGSRSGCPAHCLVGVPRRQGLGFIRGLKNGDVVGPGSQ